MINNLNNYFIKNKNYLNIKNEKHYFNHKKNR